MEKREDEVGMSASSSSWSAIEGTVGQCLEVVGSADDAVYTAKQTSKLVLEPSPGLYVPCELTVTFQKRLCYVHQIYLLSTARICEIYAQKEQDGESEYVCTVRGGIISHPEDNLPQNASEALVHGPMQDPTSAGNVSKTSSLVTLAITELDSAKVVQQQIFPSEVHSEDFVIQEKKSTHPIDGSSSLLSGHSELLFRSLESPLPGTVVEGSIIFEESLDQTDWVQCPHSPTKGSSLTSDDEDKVDINKSGFYLVVADGEAHLDHPHVLLFTDAISNPSEYASSSCVEGGHESSGPSSWQGANEVEPMFGESKADIPFNQVPSNEQNLKQGRRVEERNASSRAQLDVFENENTADTLPRTGSLMVNGECSGNSPRISRLAPGIALTEAQDIGGKLAESGRLSMASTVDRDGDMESKSLFQAPVYECVGNFVNSDAWTSVTVRLLSMKNKSRVEIHRVVVTFAPGPPIQAQPVSPREPLQQQYRSSSLLAMLLPGVRQMAQGVSESRKGGRTESTGLSFQQITDQSSSFSQQVDPAKEISPDLVEIQTQNYVPLGADQIPVLGAEERVFPMNDVAQGDTHGMFVLKTAPDGGTWVSTGHGLEEQPGSKLRQVVEIKVTGNIDPVEVKEEISEALIKEEDRFGNVVKRLDHLESICLRMESSLNSVLANMDKRLKFLESAGTGRMSSLGHPVWEAGFDSGSFVSASAGQLLSMQTVAATRSVLDPQMQFSLPSSVDLPVGESSAMFFSSTTPFYPGLLSSTSPSLISSVSSTLPLWPLSWHQHVSPDSNSHSSSLNASLISTGGQANQSNGSLNHSEQPSNEAESYWERRSSDHSGIKIPSELEPNSCSDNVEDYGLESLSLLPAKPTQLVDDALASALLAFSASFGVTKEVFCISDDFHNGEHRENKDSVTSGKGVPLVDLECFPCDGLQGEDTLLVTEKKNMHDLKATPLSNDKDVNNLNRVTIIKRECFWPSENEESHQGSLQDENSQTQAIFLVQDDLVHDPEVGKAALEDSSPAFIHTSDELCVDGLARDLVFLADLEVGIQRCEVTEAIEDDHSEAVFVTHGQDLQQNPFLQDLAFEGENEDWPQSGWPQDWGGKEEETAQNIHASFPTVGGFSKLHNGHNESLLQEDVSIDEWNWFTSEFSPFSLVGVGDLSEDIPKEKGKMWQAPLMEVTIFAQESSPNILNDKMEPWSLLDEDVPRQQGTQYTHVDAYGKDWLVQNSAWSLVDAYPPSALHAVDNREQSSANAWLGCRESRSLLDEDISRPSGDLSPAEREMELYSSSTESPEKHSSLFGVKRSPRCVDVANTPSSPASGSNPFEAESDERWEVSQESGEVYLVLGEV